MKTKRRKLAALLTAAGMSLTLAACDFQTRKPLMAEPVSLRGSLTEDIKPETPAGKDADAPFTAAQTSFSLNLLQKNAAKETGVNLLLSPYSVMQALAMTVNGAAGKTKADMEQTLGGIPADELNAYLYQYRTGQPQENGCKMLTANSVWYPDDDSGFRVRMDFLKTIADFYGAEAYQRPFDRSAVADINKWVDAKTGHMIPSVIHEISPETRMFLINACVFDSKWEKAYKAEQVREHDFHAADGSVQKVMMMFSEEKFALKDTNAKGFLKPYQGGRYAFAALLPDENLSVTDYAASLTPERMQAILSGRQIANVHAGLPKFTADYSTELRQALTDMGMGEAFGTAADFSLMSASGQKELYIAEILHKTHIEVDEYGTKAAAATAGKMTESAVEPQPFTVTLDRPFLYCILDLQTNLPVFIGIQQSVS